jgi:hypothetical protein
MTSNPYRRQIGRPITQTTNGDHRNRHTVVTSRRERPNADPRRLAASFARFVLADA